MIAFTSQLGHVIANAYVRDDAAREASGYAAGSYANMTRIASMDPAIWTELFLANREALTTVLDSFISRLNEFNALLKSNGREEIASCIAAGAKAKKDDGVRR
jgi:prephenate dehydrogenase